MSRPADQRPMDGLVEWDLTTNNGLQVVHDADAARCASVTLIVNDLEAAVADVRSLGIKRGEIATGTAAQFVSITDPDGNAITFAAPLTATNQ